ncbi:oligoribonuclease [Psychrobacter sp. FDAARGOS_221]|uniref:oligoribonuclease n=1 Tax=Psychrobacter sp. FDAARGOS_221 TaxID=1975705 RepID=UPI000BB535C2|nr:oligoribonuclease [Psychrobacter sp. FDAARGOS_221]PNK61579.1 oligoribonuclease [Psychrobacter sp. FDAARGOS_221]
MSDHPNKIRIRNQGKKGLIWIDLEMTGLDTMNDDIIEIATIVTDDDLNVLAEGPVLAIKVSDQKLNAMDDWNTKQHGQSGLIDRVRRSSVTIEEAERQTIEFLSKWVDEGKSPMCGNSICQDRRFLARQMPQLEKFFHYRNLDVSSIKELCYRWRPDILKGVEKSGTHLAMDDIRDSIRELKHYRQHFFKLLD